MIQLRMSVEQQGLVAKYLEEAPKKVQRAAYFAVKRTVTRVRKNLAKQARTEYTVKSGNVKKALSVSSPSYANIRTAITATGRQLPLSAFMVRKLARGPMKVQVKRSGGLKPVKGLFQNDAAGFSAPMHRRQPARLPLHTPGGPSVPQMVENHAVIDEVEKDGEQFLAARFEHEVAWRFK